MSKVARPPKIDNAIDFSLPDRLDAKGLRAEGFHIIVGPATVRHERFSSYRHQCRACGVWTKQIVNGVCHRCLRKVVRK